MTFFLKFKGLTFHSTVWRESKKVSSYFFFRRAPNNHCTMILGYRNEEILGLFVCIILSPLIHSRISSLLSIKSKEQSIYLSFAVPAFVFGVFFAVFPVNVNEVASSWSSFLLWYNSCLQESPVITKSITASFFTWTGDALAQAFEETDSISAFFSSYDTRRGLAFVLDGIFLSGPLLHYAYDWMEYTFPTNDKQPYISSFIHIFINDYIVDTTYIALQFVLVAIIEGHTRSIVSIFQKDFVSTVKASWLTSFGLIPVEFVCFRYFPVGYRVLCMNFIDILWQAIVSFFAHKSRRQKQIDT